LEITQDPFQILHLQAKLPKFQMSFALGILNHSSGFVDLES